jgi:hypothetical protein
MEGLNTWQAQDYVYSSKTAEHFNRPRGIAQTCKHGRYNRRKFFFIGDTNRRRGKKQVKNYSTELFFSFPLLGF